MEVPIEQMPQPARGRIESLMKTVAARTSIKKSMETARLIALFYVNIPFIVDKQVGDGTIEEWVYDRLKRDGVWVEDTAASLFEEAVITWEEATRAQLCSSIGKDVPEGYELSAAEEDEAWGRSLESAQSVADTYNEKLRGWIEAAKAEWWEEHGGSYIGLNRFNLLKLVQAKVEAYDEWKVPQIAVTEFAGEWREAVGSFWVVNKGGAEIECQMLPASASPAERDTPIICETFAGKWFPYEEALSLANQHPNCPHHPGKSRIKSGSLPFNLMIGGVMYETGELPDC